MRSVAIFAIFLVGCGSVSHSDPLGRQEPTPDPVPVEVPVVDPVVDGGSTPQVDAGVPDVQETSVDAGVPDVQDSGAPDTVADASPDVQDAGPDVVEAGPAPCTVSSILVSPGALKSGETATVTVNAACPTGAPEFEFRYAKVATPSSTVVFRAYGSQNTATFDSAGLSFEDYVVFANVRSASSPEIRSQNYQVRVDPNPPVVSGLGDFPGGAFWSRAMGMSTDGKVIVGTGTTPAGQCAFRWTESTGMTCLKSSASTSSQGYAVSPEGDVVVGSDSDTQSGEQLLYWFGTVERFSAPSGFTMTSGTAVSSHGGVVAGWLRRANGDQECMRWTRSGMVSIGYLGGQAQSCTVTGISANGVTTVGQSYIPNEGYKTFKHQPATGITDVFTGNANRTSLAGMVSSDGASLFVHDFSLRRAGVVRGSTVDYLSQLNLPLNTVYLVKGSTSDGNMLVGSATTSGTQTAVVWRKQPNGSYAVSRIKDEILAAGGGLSGWELAEATGVSADGKIVSGYGYSANGSEGFRVNYP